MTDQQDAVNGIDIRIVHVAPFYFFTTKFPHGSVRKLVPDGDLVAYELYVCDDSTFAVGVNYSEGSELERRAFELALLAYVWDQLIERGIVPLGTDMPEPVKGNVRDMLPKG